MTASFEIGQTDVIASDYLHIAIAIYICIIDQ